MVGDHLDDPYELQRHAAALWDLVADAAAPGPVSATDDSGTVHVVLEEDGNVRSITVDAGWRRALAPEALAGAVLAASRAAAREWEVAAWERLVADPRSLARLNAPGDPGPAAQVRRHPLAAAFDDLTSPSPAAEGSAALGKVEVILAAVGVASCAIDAEWAARQDGGALTGALSAALAAARAAVAGKSRGDRLLDEVRAQLTDRGEA